jgi:hypothetical protein
MAKKMTIVEQYNAIIGKAEGVLTEEELTFLRERAELHAKKNATRKPTKAQAENEAIKQNILNTMEKGVSYKVGEIQKLVGIDSNQKASALIRQLKDVGLVERTEVKGVAYFTLA